jgi:site-specific DNA recombinase
MYMDKLDGRIAAEFFDGKAPDFRAEQCRVTHDLRAHRAANRSYIENSIKLLDLARQAYSLFESQPATEKRKLLDFVVSNCRWKDGHLATYRKPFNLSRSG